MSKKAYNLKPNPSNFTTDRVREFDKGTFEARKDRNEKMQRRAQDSDESDDGAEDNQKFNFDMFGGNSNRAPVRPGQMGAPGRFPPNPAMAGNNMNNLIQASILDQFNPRIQALGMNGFGSILNTQQFAVPQQFA